MDNGRTHKCLFVSVCPYERDSVDVCVIIKIYHINGFMIININSLEVFIFIYCPRTLGYSNKNSTSRVVL